MDDEMRLMTREVKAKYRAEAANIERSKALQQELKSAFPKLTWIAMRGGAVRIMHTNKKRAIWIEVSARRLYARARIYDRPSWAQDEFYRLYLNKKNRLERVRGVLIDEGIIHA